MKRTLPSESIASQIYWLRGHRVLLSTHLAILYGVTPKALIQGVKRNQYRFPADFMFQLNQTEFNNLKSQIVTSSWGGLRRALPYAFTEQGVAMLSSVLRSRRAIEVNIHIMRTFVALKNALETSKELSRKLGELKEHLNKHDEEIQLIFKAIQRLMTQPEKPQRRIGFHRTD